jgi:hypothetical protein
MSYFCDLRTYGINAGIPISAFLAKAADLDRGIVVRIENRKNARRETLVLVVGCHYCANTIAMIQLNLDARVYRL